MKILPGDYWVVRRFGSNWIVLAGPFYPEKNMWFNSQTMMKQPKYGFKTREEAEKWGRERFTREPGKPPFIPVLPAKKSGC